MVRRSVFWNALLKSFVAIFILGSLDSGPEGKSEKWNKIALSKASGLRENLGCLRNWGSPQPPPGALAGRSDHWTPPFKGQRLATLFIVHILAKFSPGFYDQPSYELSYHWCLPVTQLTYNSSVLKSQQLLVTHFSFIEFAFTSGIYPKMKLTSSPGIVYY